ncbi:O-acetyl-ADP-ribose deacetylase [Rhodococcus spongiicola]|uniref:O-acetyl-ADP-ribose deacetylase n=1 Tax=Rhodococcus spongiicola TaxID=2487352 RepID=A0A438B4T3_9NOCA|nr:O-acetyl-ADP-ribose deacetylase [Rhodococcus spongiicola]RVW06014.1 O-acetyl-ADP-ribose deacetylase [Rhodococcus spongiicola]
MTVIEIVQGDITRQRVDAIVNAANSSLLDGGGGVDGAIKRRGGPAIVEECRTLRATTLPKGLAEGAAVATAAGQLPAKWVIHTVGPGYSRQEDRSEVLRSCYRRSLAVADELGAATVAFPLISSGTFGWPMGDAVTQAVAAVRATRTNVRVVKFVAYDREAANLLRRTVDLFSAFTVSVDARFADGLPPKNDDVPSRAPTDDDTEDDEEEEDDPGTPPALLTLMHLDQDGSESLTAYEVASVCGHDRDAVLDYLQITKEQEVVWLEHAEIALDEGDSEEADVCDHESRSWARTYESLRSALWLIALPGATRAAPVAAKHTPTSRLLARMLPE